MRVRAETALRGVFSGFVAVGAGVAAGELVALPISRFASPYQAVAAFLVDHSPAFAREWAIETFGTGDKQALMIGMSAIIVLLAALAGLVQVWRPPLGLVVVAAFAGLGVLAAATRPTMQPLYVVPPIVSGVVAGAVLILLCRGSSPRTADDPEQGWSRRQFVVAVGVIAAASAVSGLVARQVSRAGDILAERMGLRLPTPTSTAPAIPPGADLDVEGATSFMTDNATFYRIDTALQVPQLSTDDWQLRIHGMVDKEVTLTWDDLMAMGARERIVTLTCVSNEVGGDLAGTARWLGFPMTDILDQVGVGADADMLLSTSVDGWTSGSPLSAITDGRDAMLVIGMNGEPLPLEHGYPVRQVIPGLYGYVSACKWVVDWEITRFDRAQAYWTKRGWGVRGPIKTASRIDRPAPLSVQPPGKVIVAGTAWAQHRGIDRVEVRVDDGPWQQAELAPEYSIDTWRQWFWEWDAPAGQHTLYCRATDKAGRTQPEQRVAPIPDGATGWHSRVLRIEA
ncbi:molybdopterin-dependent oxidoreductase [Gordonia insulae]|uniref:Protein-methionine-sulfoxide reductase catalytic subunit MsrP n=1 Tax=Gordonia insulae TaxID=2420509 RepID=A0A3G8JS04_9ACTN|nr:molybdopterin-dependent oxidoreductase [Gordonia insulae]AZG47262.1 Protein-methionine-sulfoxide reductase catalytic subunit MsrP [Gordonia insulae]